MLFLNFFVSWFLITSIRKLLVVLLTVSPYLTLVYYTTGMANLKMYVGCLQMTSSCDVGTAKKEVQTINHNYILINLLQWTDINVFINSDLNPEKHNTQTVYIHLFTFLQHVSVVLSNHHEVENTST